MRQQAAAASPPLVLLLLLVLVVSATRGDDMCLVGAGGTLPEQVYHDAIFAYTLVSPDVKVQYAALGSPQGQCRIMAVPNPTKCSATDTTQPLAVDFAASDVPLEVADYALNPDLEMYPTMATAIVPVFNLNAAANLTLSTAVLAQIFSGQILTWDDPRIVALNPNFSTWRVPARQRIEVVVRDSGSGTTGVFRQALCYFDSVFAQQVGPGTGTAWSGVNVTWSARPQAYITATPYTIGYTNYGVARDYGLPVAALQKSSGVVVTASMATTGYAMLEMDVTLGNDSGHMTADLIDAKGDHAWPIATFTYLVMRKSQPRSGAGCSVVRAVAAFWYWYWTAGVTANIIRSDGFTPLPENIRATVVRRFIADIHCAGQPVLAVPQPVVVPASGVDWVAPIFKKFALIYDLVAPDVTVSYRSDNTVSQADVNQRLTSDAFVASRVLWASPLPLSGGVDLVLGGIAVAVISKYNITLDLPTLAAILDGNVTTWLHPDLLRLNSGAIPGPAAAVPGPTQCIVLLAGPTAQDPFLATTLRSLVPGFSGATLAAARRFPTEDMLRAAVSATPFSLSVSVMVGAFEPNLQFARLRRPDGAEVAPSWKSVQACAAAAASAAPAPSAAVPSVVTDLQLQQSSSCDCYPLATAVYVAVRQSQCSMATDPQRTAAVAFLEWLLLHPALPDALQDQGVAPLSILPSVAASNKQALAAITCTPLPPVPSPTPDWLPVVGGVCGGIVLLLAGGLGAWVWKSTADIRALRRQFANDNVAQECAAAIASFDLEAVEWLKTLEKPNRIQQSFLQIIHLLTQVRPFIPDQLLAALQRGGSPGSADVLADLPSSEHRLSDASSTSPSAVTSSCDSPASSHQTASRAGSSPHAKGLHRPASRGQLYASRGLEWRQKVGAFMYVRFSFLTDTMEFLPQRMAAVLMDLVTIAKAHGATIDHVAYGSLALHWGVAFGTAQGPLKSVTAALEMSRLRQHLSEEDREDLRLRIGLAYGPCDVSTASAAGHSFFIVAGPEVQTAINMVGQDLMARCKCEILLTQALHKEVGHAVDCMPRLWFHDVLLWEPLRLRACASSTDEWMYELHSLEVKDNSRLSATTLQAVFMLARNRPAHPVVHAEVRRLRERYAADLTEQDRAALDCLEAGGGVMAQ